MEKEYLFNLNYPDFRKVFEKNIAEKLGTKWMRDSKIKWSTEDGTINVIVIRCNDIYITNDEKRNNDYLVIIENTPEGSMNYIFNCTADPKYKRDGIANLCEQIYYGNIRNHRWTFGRLAICQDFCEVYVIRFIKGKPSEECGLFKINIHDNGSSYNSSLGCVIIATQQENKKYYQPLLSRVRKIQERNIPVAVIRDVNFVRLLES